MKDVYCKKERNERFSEMFKASKVSCQCFQYYDAEMEELKRMKVDLPDRGTLPYPKIIVKLTVDEETGWKNRAINGEAVHPLIQVI